MQSVARERIRSVHVDVQWKAQHDVEQEAKLL